MRFAKKLASALGLVLTAVTTVAGTSSLGYASVPTASATSHAGTTIQASGLLRPQTPPDSACGGAGDYGWFGIAPGSPADGGVANDLWLDSKNGVQNTPVWLWTGNGGNAQQWCIAPAVGSSAYAQMFWVFAHYGTSPSCLDVTNGDNTHYASGTRVQAYTCYGSPGGGRAANQLWYICARDQTRTFSLEPAFAPLSSEWLDVWGGPGSKAFVQGNPLQIWPGNGADNQRFTAFTSPGSQSSPVPYSQGIAGC
ncbi:RICIN domain-containing protein [Streptacidiphilus sp. EB103A]|uniref:RICIN domain-containing protein n=1 Tax=Streptacidiphilus sp. EB103A TaxID=3156275 RepID=UPI0035148495